MCVSTDDDTVLDKPFIESSDYLLQRVSITPPHGDKDIGKWFVLDLDGSQIAKKIDVEFSDIFVPDLNFVPIDQEHFMDTILPKSFMDNLIHHKTTLTIALMITGAILVVTKFGAVQITIAIAAMSILVGVITSIGSMNKLIERMR